MRKRPGFIATACVCFLLSLFPLKSDPPSADWVVVHPREYPGALRNPLMGFRTDKGPFHPWVTLWRTYIPWNSLENDESDGIEKIRATCDKLWGGCEKQNIKIIPRVYLNWPKGKSSPEKNYWPADMTAGDFTSAQFKQRVARLIQRLGEVWDDDPRVAFVQTGIFGQWGEQHDPAPTPDMQQFVGKAYMQAFPHKRLTRRYPDQFRDFPFGMYWDSWAHADDIVRFQPQMLALNQGELGNEVPVEGEVAYDWGHYEIQPGKSPTETVSDPAHRQFLIDSIRLFHGTDLGWVSNYNQNDLAAVKGAEEVQKAFGYRFVIDEARYPRKITHGVPFTVDFEVRNTGSAPFYYAWPVELSLLDAHTHQPIWRETFCNLDISAWLPGSSYDSKNHAYRVAPKIYPATGTFTLPASIPPGNYILALAILDPSGMQPSARFAIENYFTGGHHPLGHVGVDQDIPATELDPAQFDLTSNDLTLHYKAKP